MGKAVTLRDGYIWLLAPGQSPQPLTGFGDVSVKPNLIKPARKTCAPISLRNPLSLVYAFL
jgi:hypothetical protein